MRPLTLPLVHAFPPPQVKSGADKSLSGLLRRHVFVGVADQGLSLVQCDTKLILANHMELSRELFFQLAVRR